MTRLEAGCPEPTLSEVEALLAHPHLARALDLELGVATSSFQTEGGLNGPGLPETHWGAWERAGKVERSYPGAGLWHHFADAVARVRSMGLRVFRFSLEWSRLCPTSEALDARAVEGYASRIRLVREAGVEPIVTLSHFTHPAWMGPDLWLSYDAPKVFAAYAESAVAAINARLVRDGVKPIVRIVTLNEPNMLAFAAYAAGVFPHGALALAEGSPVGLLRALQAYDHLLAAHVLAVRALRRRYTHEGWGAPDCSTNLNVTDLHGLGKLGFDLLRAPSLGVTARGLSAFIEESRARFHDDLFEGQSTTVEARVARHLDAAWTRFSPPGVFPRTLSLVFEKDAPSTLDHLAIDVYDPYTAHQLRHTPSVVDVMAKGDLATIPDAMARDGGFRLAEPWEWEHTPQALVRAIRAMRWPASPLPIDIDECGMAVHRPEGETVREREDGLRRPTFLRTMVKALIEARVVHDLPVRAFCVWTLLDNYELGRWSPRFGVYALDRRGSEDAAWSYRDALGDDSASVLAGLAHGLEAGQSPESIAQRLRVAYGG